MDAQRIKDTVKFIDEQSKLYKRKIYLVAATKYIEKQALNVLLDSGVTILGENKAQDFRDKFEGIKNAELHFIGHLQKNKVKYLIGKCSLIHSVDSVEIAEEIDRQSALRGVVTDILLEINISDCETKSGIDRKEFNINDFTSFKHIRLCGLMAMLAKGGDEETLKNETLAMKMLFDSIKATEAGKYFKYLSIGMSDDYKTAIKYGSNMVRLGRTLYGI